MKIYLLGPMTGYPDYNRGQFNAVAEQLRRFGHTVENPAEFPEPEIPTREAYLKIALPRLFSCDIAATLPGWQESWGASLEVYNAQQLKIPVVPYTRIGETDELPGTPNRLGIYAHEF